MTLTGVLPRARADLPAARNAPRRQYHRLGLEYVQRSVVTVVCETSGDAPVGLEQPAHSELHEHVHTHVDTLLLQGTNQLEARGIADVGQPRVGVAAEVALAGQSLRRPVEDGAPLLELTNPVWRLLRMNLGHPPVPEVLATLHRVTEVGLPRVPVVLVSERRRRTTLGHHGMRLAQHRLANHRDAHPGSAGLDGGAQPGATSADDYDIVLVCQHLIHHKPPHSIMSVSQPMVQA